MHPVSILTFGIFFAGYVTARWDLVTRLYELVIFAWDHGVIVCLDIYLGDTLPLDYKSADVMTDTRCQGLRHPLNPLPRLPHPNRAHRCARSRTRQSARYLLLRQSTL